MAKLEAIQAGVDECIMLNHEGCVSEGTGDNLFIVREGQLHTPPTSAGILEGITRNLVIKLARRRGYTMTEQTLIRFDLWIADEVFLTGTAAEIISVTEIDHRRIGTGKRGPITRALKEDFESYTRGKLKLD
jgi:branched-chain amino acid aminotransferase